MGSEKSWLEKYHSMPVPSRDPCEHCSLADDRQNICPARARWWDHQIRGERAPVKIAGYASQLWSAQDRISGKWVAVDLPIEECAQAIGLKTQYLREVHYRQTHGRPHKQWHIEKRSRRDAAVEHVPSPRHYTVYDNRTDEMVCLDATAQDAARAMGLRSMDSFYSAVHRARAGQNHRWHIEIEEVDSHDD